ncbi:AMP-binding protein [Citricoccus sp. K5]|uniref:AMP-binding protein n=1 Tax=Citricoccus sp. K5 TaxID=2653135 RepID=UPI0012F329F0|nr:AMP-binding protein [Citricoccus sp. K5]VXB76401.1 O-succinylbenzoic acid--CoA ligase [Citricoccus sp. K5]
MPVTPADLDRAQRALAAALDGSGPPVEFTEGGQIVLRPEAADPAAGGAEGTVAVVRTSGSTGTPKQTLLTPEALAASAAATASRIGGEGQWLLAVGLHYVAGLAVLSRSLTAGTTPVALAPGPFTPQSFVEAVDRMERGTGFRALSLVPTMLSRLLVPDAGPGASAPSGAGFAGAAVDALRTFDAILIGGARLPDRVREAAAEAGLRIHLTYGMSETCGGCVYDGVPLDGVTADLVTDPDTDADGGGRPGVPRLRLSGPMVAAGYFNDADRTAAHFGISGDTRSGTSTRWFLTGDTGTVDGAPGRQHLTVTGRVDDVINTGGVKVSAAKVQQVLESLAGVQAAFVGAVRDDEWGQRVCAAVAGGQSRPPFDQAAAREAIRARLGPAAVPKQWLVLEALPLLPNGKTDRQALLTRFST